MTTLEFVDFVASESNNTRADVLESAATGLKSRRVPFLMPASETYYWSSQWQRDEAETLADGERVVFDSDDPEDAAKWLRDLED